jgi:hypothetical protein
VKAASIDSDPLVLRGKNFGFWPKLTDLGRLSAQIVALNPSAVVVARSQASAAILAKDGVYLATSSTASAKLIDSRRNLIAPSIDPYGYAWSVPATDAAAIRITGPDGVSHSIPSPLTGRPKVVSLQVSHDGTRILLYLKTATVPRLVVLGVVRSDGNVPSSLGTPLDLPVTAANPVDATWVDSMSIAALSESGGKDTVVTYTIGGTGGEPSTPVDAVHIVGGSGEQSLRLINLENQVLQLRSSGWQELGITASVLATQQ